MPEKPQIELKDTQEPSEKSSDGLEIAQTPELESVVAKANQLAEAIQQDRNVTGEQVLDLEKDLGELKFDVCGEQMTLAEIKEIPDFKHNLVLWKKIMEGGIETSDLTYIIPTVAQKYVDLLNTLFENRQPSGPQPENFVHIDLNNVKKISTGTAKELRKFKGSILLNGLMKISDEATQELGQSASSSICLDGLASISDSQAQHLSHFKGPLWLRGVDSLSDAAAMLIGKRQTSRPTLLNNLAHVSDKGLKFLDDEKIQLPFKLKERLEKLKVQQNATRS